MHVRSAKAHLQNRFGAAVAEVDHHEVWQRARLTLSVVTATSARPSGCSPTPSAIWPRVSGSSAPVSDESSGSRTNRRWID